TRRLPHVHHCQPNCASLLLAQPVIELRHARLRAVLAAEPDRASSNQIAHHNAIGVALADCNLVNADHLGSRRACLRQLRAHVLLLEGLDRIPVELQFLRQVLDRRRTTTPTYVMGKAFGIERVVGQELQPRGHPVCRPPPDKAQKVQCDTNPRLAKVLARSSRRSWRSWPTP